MKNLGIAGVGLGLLALLVGVVLYVAATSLADPAQQALTPFAEDWARETFATEDRFRVLGLQLALLGGFLATVAGGAWASRVGRPRRALRRVGIWACWGALVAVAAGAVSYAGAADYRNQDLVDASGREVLTVKETELFKDYRVWSHRTRGWLLASGGLALLGAGLIAVGAARSRGMARLFAGLSVLGGLAMLGWAWRSYGGAATPRWEIDDFLVTGLEIDQYRALLVAVGGSLLVIAAVAAHFSIARLPGGQSPQKES